MDLHLKQRQNEDDLPRTDDARGSFSSFATGTSKFFNSVIAKKNGLLKDFSSKFESTFGKSVDSEESDSPSPPSPKVERAHPRRLQSRKDTDLAGGLSASGGFPTRSVTGGEPESALPNGVQISFDEPLYCPENRQDDIDFQHSQTSETTIPTDNNNKAVSSEEGKSTMAQVDRRAGKLSMTRRRSSTVDEMLFDDYVEPEEEVSDPVTCAPGAEDIQQKRRTLIPMGDLISFDEDYNRKESKRSDVPSNQSSIDSSDGGFVINSSVESSDAEFGGEMLPRSTSMGSEQSWSSTYSIESQPDDITLECMEFMKSFVEKIFNANQREEITQMEKAKFGELCQYVPGRLWFSRYVNSQRVHNKKVDEQIFFRLVQYFAVVLFECHEAEDFSPAKSLMNMCFTFFYETQQAGKNSCKHFLYNFLKEQPIWHSLRFWNAAFFDAVQCERARRPVCTSEDGSDEKSDDSEFQENITFGQLGTFTCNMRAFGLGKELCLEFLRKQSTIADLKTEQVQLLRNNVEK